MQATGPSVVESIRETRSLQIEDRQRRLRERAAPAIAISKAAKQALRRFDADHAEIIETVSSISRSECLADTPRKGGGAPAQAQARIDKLTQDTRSNYHSGDPKKQLLAVVEVQILSRIAHRDVKGAEERLNNIAKPKPKGGKPPHRELHR